MLAPTASPTLRPALSLLIKSSLSLGSRFRRPQSKVNGGNETCATRSITFPVLKMMFNIFELLQMNKVLG